MADGLYQGEKGNCRSPFGFAQGRLSTAPDFLLSPMGSAKLMRLSYSARTRLLVGVFFVPPQPSIWPIRRFQLTAPRAIAGFGG
jgi:hypothetical protein